MSITLIPRSNKASAEGLPPVVIRPAQGSDCPALRKLAERDSARLPAEPLIVAAVGEEILAAASVSDGAVVADPFLPTAELAALAELRAAQLRGAPRDPLRLLARSAPAPPRPVGDTP